MDLTRSIFLGGMVVATSIFDVCVYICIDTSSSLPQRTTCIKCIGQRIVASETTNIISLSQFGVVSSHKSRCVSTLLPLKYIALNVFS